MILFGSSDIGTASNADSYGNPAGQSSLDDPAVQQFNEASVRKLVCEREQAKVGQQNRTELIQMLSHDLRSPLSVIRAVSSLLVDTTNAQERQDLLELLDQATDSILSLVDQVLDGERLRAGGMQLEIEHLDLHALLFNCVDQFETLAHEKNIELNLRIDDAVPAAILADPVKLGQIIRNLTGNAVKFTTSGSVTVAVRMLTNSGHSQLELSVEDTGIGIAPDRIPLIFESFSQATADIGRAYGGFGLGLAICQKLLALHGSALDVRSVPGVGSRFWFILQLDSGAGGPRSDE